MNPQSAENQQKKSTSICCVCGLPATKSMKFVGGEQEWPEIHYCDKHSEYNDNIGFEKRSFGF